MGAGEPGSPFSRLIDSINTWTEYNFDDNIVSQRSILRDEIGIESRLRDTLCSQLRNFSFNVDQDTIIVEISGEDYLMIPGTITAYSSKEVVNIEYIVEGDLFGEHTAQYKETTYDGSGDKYPYFYAIKNNDLEAFNSFYNEYGIPSSEMLGIAPDKIYRIEIKNGKVQSVSKWIFMLDYLKLYHESLTNSTRQNNR